VDELRAHAASFAPMPGEPTDLISRSGAESFTFASGTPWNDVEFTTFDTDYIEGETSGYDTFVPADPGDTHPGAHTVKMVRAVSHPTIDRAYGGAPGDRIVLGIASNPLPFFHSPGDGSDDDFVVVQNFDYVNGHLQLVGAPEDYALVQLDQAESANDGWFLLYTAAFASSGEIDLIAYVQRCDDVRTRQIGTAPLPDVEASLCNASGRLDLADARQFRFVVPGPPAEPALPGIVQTGSPGREIVGGIATDRGGNVYLFGATDGNLDGGDDPGNEIFVVKHDAAGRRLWTTEVATLNGALLLDAVADDRHLYAVGRTFGSLPGFASAGVWDGIILKLRLDDGAIVATDQWGDAGIDGYGAVTLDDAGNLYVSGAGSPPAATVDTGDNAFLVAKHSAATLASVWRRIEPVLPTSRSVAEAWCGVTYVPESTPGAGRLVVGGWFANPPNGADGFLALYGDLAADVPTRLATATIGGQTTKADRVVDNEADAAGNVYAVGYTTSALDGAHAGEGDAFIVKYDRDLANPRFRQIGTARSDQLREVAVGANGMVYAIGHTYGALVAPNRDPEGLTGDLVVYAFDTDLNPVASIQLGTPGEERGYLALHGENLYVGGMTEGSLAGANTGSFDAFALRLDPHDLTPLPAASER